MTKEEAKKRQAELKCKIETCKDSIRYLNGKISELEAIINKKDDWRDKLVKGEYVVVSGIKGFFIGDNRDRDKIEHTFKEESHAKIMANKMQLMQEMHAFAHVKNEGWVANWEDKDKFKWGITFSRNDVFAGWQFLTNGFIFGIAVKSEKIAQEMLEEFGERIKTIYNKQY